MSLPIDHHVGGSPFRPVLEKLSSAITNSLPDTVHRIVLPSLLSPVMYPPHASSPQHVLQFLHSLRALLSRHRERVTAMATLPTSLYPRSTGLVRWMEILQDGVIELSPFPHSTETNPSYVQTGPGVSEDPPQGLLHIHRLPVLHDSGSGLPAAENDWTFSLSRRKFNIKPFNLPPLEGDKEAQAAVTSTQKGNKSEMEF